jgi:hypothetical protein
MSAPLNSRALRRVEVAVLSKRGLDLMRKFGMSGLQREVWIEVQEGKAICFYNERHASIRAMIGGATNRMLGFQELASELVRAADETEQSEAPRKSQSGYFGFLCELAVSSSRPVVFDMHPAARAMLTQASRCFHPPAHPSAHQRLPLVLSPFVLLCSAHTSSLSLSLSATPLSTAAGAGVAPFRSPASASAFLFFVSFLSSVPWYASTRPGLCLSSSPASALLAHAHICTLRLGSAMDFTQL